MNEKMPIEHYRSLGSLEDHYWWHQTRYQIVWRVLTERIADPRSAMIADLGCGTGGFLRFLRRRGVKRLLGADYADSALGMLERDGIPTARIDLEGAFRLPEGPYDALVALDVIEHLADERPFLDSVRVNLRAGGLLALTAPAHAFLFSEWDRTLRHYRRYSRAGVSRLLDGAGFRVLETSHFFSFALPMAVARRYVGAYDGSAACEFPAVSALLNRALLQAGRIEGALLRRIRVPFGTSLYVVAQCRQDR